MQHVIAALIVLLTFGARPSSAQSSLDWQKVQVEQGPNDLKKVTFSGQADPKSYVKVDHEGIIIVSPDPSGIGSDPQFVFPMMYSDYIAARKIEPNSIKSQPKEVAVTIRDCELRAHPDEKSPKKGRVAKGKRLPAKRHNVDWLKFMAKGRVLYVRTSCVAFGPNAQSDPFRVRANAKGEFVMTLELPPGMLQIPVELVSKSKTKAFVASVEIKADEELKLETPKPSEPNVAAGVEESVKSLHLLSGVDSYSYKQSGDIGSFDFKANALALGLGLEWVKPSYALSFRYRRFQGELSSSAPIAFSAKKYTLERMRAEFTKGSAGRSWSPILGLDYIASPLIASPDGSASVFNLKSYYAVVGLSLSPLTASKFLHSFNAIAKAPLYQEAAGESSKSLSGYEIELGYLPQYQISKSLFLGINLEAIYGSTSFLGTKRTTVNVFVGGRLGFDF